MNCDHSYAAKIIGNKSASCNEGRCPYCTADFSSLDANSLWKIDHFSVYYKSYLQYWIILHDLNFTNIESVKNLYPGFTKFPPLLLSWYEAEQKNIITYKEGLNWLKNFKIGFDNLHNSKGFTKCFLNMLKESKDIYFKNELFKKLNYEYIKKYDINSYSGIKYRLLVTFYKEIILPCVETTEQKKKLIEQVI